MKIPVHLQPLAQFVPRGARVADIGCDHGILSTYLILSGIAAAVIACDLRPGPLNACAKRVRRYDLADKIELRLGNGLNVLHDGEVDTIVVAGLGGRLVTRILEEGKSKLQNVRKLILQPRNGEHIVRRWLCENGWPLDGEILLEETGYFYETLSAAPGDGEEPYRQHSFPREALFHLGPIQICLQPEISFKKWKRKKRHYEAVVQELSASSRQQAVSRRRQFQELAAVIEGVIQAAQQPDIQ